MSNRVQHKRKPTSEMIVSAGKTVTDMGPIWGSRKEPEQLLERLVEYAVGKYEVILPEITERLKSDINDAERIKHFALFLCGYLESVEYEQCLPHRVRAAFESAMKEYLLPIPKD